MPTTTETKRWQCSAVDKQGHRCKRTVKFGHPGCLCSQHERAGMEASYLRAGETYDARAHARKNRSL
jgi:hypothetical protein